MKSFLHSGDLGDIIYSLPSVKHLGGGAYNLINLPAVTRPMTPELFAVIQPLIAAQPYIKECKMHDGGPVDYDFTDFRAIHMRGKTLAESHARHITGQYVDFSQPWLEVPKKKEHGRPVFARSPRYNNPEWEKIWPEILRQHKCGLFIGTTAEHEEFEKRFGHVEHAKTKTLLDVAELIAGSSIFVGNQSCPFAIAEGLKHARILEAHQPTMDCIYRGGSIRHILTEKEFFEPKAMTPFKREPEVIMLALQCCGRDQEDALELVKCLVALENNRREDVEFAICFSKSADQKIITEIAELAAKRFAKIHIVRSMRFGTGWPHGCNDLWQESMSRIASMKSAGRTKATGVLTFEPDCIPLRADWLDVLISEWANRPKEAKAIGHIHNRTHLNGNAMFETGIVDDITELTGCDSTIGWDVAHAKRLLPISHDTTAIFQEYRIKEITDEQLDGIRKNGFRPAMMHGLKGGCGISWLQKLCGIR